MSSIDPPQDPTSRNILKLKVPRKKKTDVASSQQGSRVDGRMVTASRRSKGRASPVDASSDVPIDDKVPEHDDHVPDDMIEQDTDYQSDDMGDADLMLSSQGKGKSKAKGKNKVVEDTSWIFEF